LAFWVFYLLVDGKWLGLQGRADGEDAKLRAVHQA
jgi:hypothetical protein